MIILFGLAGSGKGTQGQALARIFGWRWISNGQVIRDNHRYDEVINRGELIPDQAVIDMMNAEIRKARTEGYDVVLDGYPRDVTQAKYLMQHFADQINGAFILDVPKEELYRRLAERSRADDHSRAAIDQRFAVFEQNIYPILDLLQEHHIPVQHIDGTGAPEEVTARLQVAVANLISKDQASRSNSPNPLNPQPNPSNQLSPSNQSTPSNSPSQPNPPSPPGPASQTKGVIQ